MANDIVVSSSITEFGFTSPPLVLSRQLEHVSILPEQILAALVAVLRARSPALSNTFFTAGLKFVGYSGSMSFQNPDAILRAVQEQTVAIAEQSAGWKRHLFSIHASADVDSISETIEGVFEAISRFGPASIDLTRVDATSTNGEHLAALLRATFPWKENVPGWQHGLDVAKSALERAGIDPRAALVGLL